MTGSPRDRQVMLVARTVPGEHLEMRLLVLGGSAFVGRAVTVAALTHGWEVTTFNRGVTGPDVAGVQAFRGDRLRRTDLDQLAAAGPWDAAVDTSGYVPRDVLAAARVLEPVVRQYLFVSSLSVYADWPVRPLTEASPVLSCPYDAGPDYGPPDQENGPTRYGRLKAGCEQAARVVFGPGRVTVLRAGVILGPGEYVGRLPWWLRRVAAGGQVLAPGSPDRSVQPVDVRDVAAFTLECVARSRTGVYNVTAPIGRETFGGMLDACRGVTGSHARSVWVPDAVLLRWGVRQWSELPLWRTHPGVWHVDSARAHAAGLTCRPIRETVRDTWAWMATAELAANARSNEIGLDPRREEKILGAFTRSRPTATPARRPSSPGSASQNSMPAYHRRLRRPAN
jgi:2'-hydroxyisoflavone reductase